MIETPLQNFVRTNGIDAIAELGIKSYRHPSLPLWGFKYNQIDSPKLHPVVVHARGTVLEEGSWDLVAQPFTRFFNYGENEADTKLFNWNQCVASTKEDGSLGIVSWYDGEWHVNTSGSFGLGEVNYSGLTWRELFWESADFDKSRLDRRYTYIFELCTPWNKVVRRYERGQTFLLGVFKTGVRELDHAEVQDVARFIGAQTPKVWNVSGYDEVLELLGHHEKSDPTFEGFVLRDNRNIRIKTKTKTYLSLHHLADNGNVCATKNVVPIILSGRDSVDEVLTYFPEFTDRFNELDNRINTLKADLISAYAAAAALETQKDFALAVKDHPLSGIAFRARKEGKTIDEIWRESGDYIVKILS